MIDWDGVKLLLAHPSGYFVENGVAFLVYVRDHTEVDVRDRDNPERHKKLHFFMCSTLMEMGRNGFFRARYRRTNRRDDRYLVEYAGGEMAEVPLLPCANCLIETGYGGCSKSSPRSLLGKTKANFKAEEVFAFIRNVLSGRHRQE